MISIKFEYKKISTTIKCDKKEPFKNVIQKFADKNGIKNFSNLIFLYLGKTIDPESKSTFEQVACSDDKKNGEMKIVVCSIDKESELLFNKDDNNSELNNKNPTNKELLLIILEMKKKIEKIEEKNNSDLNNLKNEISNLKNELNNINKKNSLNNELETKININTNINNKLLIEIENNTNRNNQLLNDIKEKIIQNDKIQKELLFNRNKKSEIKNYIDNLFKEMNFSINTPSNNFFVRGMIIAWIGNSFLIPEKWAICDGKNGTPDLRNRFILGASDDHNLYKIGGKSSIVLQKTNLPKLGKGCFSADSHNGYYHHKSNGFVKFQGQYKASVKTGHADDWGSNWIIDLDDGMNSSPIDIMNPYYSLLYIMKL